MTDGEVTGTAAGTTDEVDELALYPDSLKSSYGMRERVITSRDSLS